MDASLPTDVRSAWFRFLNEAEGLRPELYRYCRYLTRSPWDAEDLVQDTLVRAFASLAHTPLENPRAYLFRIASNTWLNRLRRAKLEHGEPVADEAPALLTRETREATGTLLAQLAPQERAAVVLKDVFDFSLVEIATALGTTQGAIKSALHRGRGKLAEPEDPPPHPVERALVDELCAAFNARDLERLTGLLLESVVVELPGIYSEVGVATAREGMLHGALFGCQDPAVLAASTPALRIVRERPAQVEVRVYRGEPIVLCWWDGAVRSLMRVETDGPRVSRMLTYLHAPDVIAEVCSELGVPFELVGYGM